LRRVRLYVMPTNASATVGTFDFFFLLKKRISEYFRQALWAVGSRQRRPPDRAPPPSWDV